MGHYWLAAAISSGGGSPKTTPNHGVGSPNKNPEGDNLEFIPKGNEKILYVESLPSEMDFELITHDFEEYGKIKVIRLSETEDFKNWKVWIEYATHKEALKAYKEGKSTKKLTCYLTDKISSKQDFDVFYPSVLEESTTQEEFVERDPLPPKWLIATTKSDYCNLYHFRKQMRRSAGPIANSEITRFGRNSFLIHAKSYRQGHMIMKSNSRPHDVIKQIKPHYNFSYAKGVIFNQDLYELSVDEILDMCPMNVWKVFKIPRSKMIIFTFKDEHLPEEIFIENERFPVRPYKYRPLQCFKCFGYGHSSKVCTRIQICSNCSLQEHERDCTDPVRCINCTGHHGARDKTCQVYKRELAAVEKANSEHLSIGQAKRLLGSKPNFSEVVKGIYKLGTKTPNVTGNQTHRLHPSELEIHHAPQSSQASSQAPCQGVALTSSEVSRTSSGVSRASSGVHRASSGVQRASPQVHRASSEVHQASSEVHQVSSEVHRASSGVHRASSEVHQASPEVIVNSSWLSQALLEEASQAISLPDLGIINEPMESEATCTSSKRARNPSSSPDQSPKQHGSSKKKDRSLEALPPTSVKPKNSPGKSSKSKAPSNKPNLSRPSKSKSGGKSKDNKM